MARILPAELIMVISSTAGALPPLVCMMEGTPGNRSFHVLDILEVPAQVANEEMYKCGVDCAAGPAVKYVAKLADSIMSSARPGAPPLSP